MSDPDLQHDTATVGSARAMNRPSDAMVVVSTPDPRQLLQDCAAAHPALPRHLATADHHRDDYLAVEDWLLDAHGVPAEAEPALAAGRLDTAGRGHGWLRVDALSLVISRDRLVALPRIHADAADAAALVDAVLAQMPPIGVRHAFGHERLIDLDAPIDARLSPVWRTAGRPLDAHLPDGPRGPEWRRWLTEAQMLLHEHPLNADREARGLRPLNALWLAGGAATAPATRDCGMSVFGHLPLGASLPVAQLQADATGAMVWLHKPGSPPPDAVVRRLARSDLDLRILEPSGQQCFVRQRWHGLRVWRKPLLSLTTDRP